MLPQNASQPLNAGTFTPEQVAAEQAAFMRKVYAIMTFGLAATGLTALVVFHSEAATRFIFGTPGVYLGLIIAELVMVFTFAALARRMSAVGAAALFYIYAILNGLTLSVVFLIYTKGSIASTFFVTAGTFGAMSAYGYVTKRDLTSVGNFMFMGLIGLILASAFSAIIVYAQALVPGNVGLIAGLFFGLAFGVAGVGSALLGWLADHTSISFVFKVCAYLPLLGLLTGFLPEVERPMRR